ncbi:MAG: class F sortase, partial [Dermatophilaceae bacterium]
PLLGIDAPLVAEGLDARGSLVVPGDPGTVGLWDGGPDLGAAEGTTLLAGHVDVAGVGPGALVGLSRVAPGAWMITSDGLGRGRAWRVASLAVRRKDDRPLFRPPA